MIVYGYVKDVKYSGDGTLMLQVRVPNMHGAYAMSDYKGKPVRNYVSDANLPWYPSLILPHEPTEGEVVAMSSLGSSSSDWLVIGLTGGSYNTGATSL